MNIEKFYPYKELQEKFGNDLKKLEGKVLHEVRLQIIEPEINVVVLIFEDETFSVQGQLGGELLDLVERMPSPPEELGPHAWYEPFEEARPFLGCAVVQARPIGEPWNGHGLELSFESNHNETLIVQSNDAGGGPKGFHDCLRIGVGRYVYSSEKPPNRRDLAK
mgnify:CR=1 FL=1